MKRLSMMLLAVLLLAWSAAGQTGTQSQSQTSAGASSSTNVNVDKGGVKARNDTSISASQQTNANSNSIAAGTTINAVLTKGVDSRKAKEGDEVTAKSTSAMNAEGERPIPKGTKLIGHITKANARAKGDSESALGIIFDRAEVAKGREVPIHAVVQALAVARTGASAGMTDDSMGGMSTPPPSGGTPSNSNGGGGLVGGAVNTAGNTVSRTTGDIGNTTGQAAGSAVGAAGSAVGNTAGSVAASSSSTLTATSQGVIGLPGYTLDTNAANATQGSVITSSGKNVKLDSGTQMVLRVVSE